MQKHTYPNILVHMLLVSQCVLGASIIGGGALRRAIKKGKRRKKKEKKKKGKRKKGKKKKKENMGKACNHSKLKWNILVATPTLLYNGRLNGDQSKNFRATCLWLGTTLLNRMQAAATELQHGVHRDVRRRLRRLLHAGEWSGRGEVRIYREVALKEKSFYLV